ncbi:alpha/beta hydrolase fold domain-containing protein [Aeromicrobium sp. UC242_57]|uniref:alpha/beta hydrolase fold domain-containing protein n=1 Tax=Aeromicrobium sp. UC242_57 TaxID=3374624 RepID=UPI00378CCE66
MPSCRPLANATLDGAGIGLVLEPYAPGELGDHPEVSPACADNLAEHPPAFILTCEHDVLRDQAELYAAQLAAAGVEVTAHRALGMVHSFWRQPDVFDASRSAVTFVGALLDAQRARAR